MVPSPRDGMEFDSLTFLAFFAAVLVLHNLPLPWRVRKANLFLASLLFYAAWDPPFVLLLLANVVLDFFVGLGLAAAATPGRRRALLLLSLCGNLGVLGWFKYGALFLDSVVRVAALLGVTLRPAAPSFVLPIGISFYTFHTMSYVIDVYRRRTEPCRSLVDFGLYVTFFPQLVAGPIMRAGELLPQCSGPRASSPERLGWGMGLFVAGLFLKLVVADALSAPVADAVYGAPVAPTFGAAWAGTLAFSAQIWADFCGYSLCAVGAAHALGFELRRNFHAPYAAIGFSDFWRRWHISLSSWLKDYLYVPLGGARRGRLLTYRNLMITMLLGGLWHGASFRFVVWGGLHGVYLTVERLVRGERRTPRLRSTAAKVAMALVTYLVVSFTWVFFRAASISRALVIAGAMLGRGPANGFGLLTHGQVTSVLGVSAAIFAGHWLLRERTWETLVDATPWFARSVGLAFILVLIATCLPGTDRVFLYFQF
jgi:alginate O-acetyltransferase complex protein AlgI